MPFSYQTFYHLNSKLVVLYSRLDFDERIVLDHLNTKLACYSDPLCILIMDFYCYSVFIFVYSLSFIQLNFHFRQSSNPRLSQLSQLHRPSNNNNNNNNPNTWKNTWWKKFVVHRAAVWQFDVWTQSLAPATVHRCRKRKRRRKKMLPELLLEPSLKMFWYCFILQWGLKNWTSLVFKWCNVIQFLNFPFLNGI